MHEIHNPVKFLFNKSLSICVFFFALDINTNLFSVETEKNTYEVWYIKQELHWAMRFEIRFVIYFALRTSLDYILI